MLLLRQPRHVKCASTSAAIRRRAAGVDRPRKCCPSLAFVYLERLSCHSLIPFSATLLYAGIACLVAKMIAKGAWILRPHHLPYNNPCTTVHLIMNGHHTLLSCSFGIVDVKSNGQPHCQFYRPQVDSSHDSKRTLSFLAT